MTEETQDLLFPKEIRVAASRGSQQSDEGKEERSVRAAGKLTVAATGQKKFLKEV